MNAIEVVDLEKRFGDFVAVDKLNMQVREGEIKAIVGENGAGKTTLMNMIFGMLTPTSGKIYIRGDEVHFHSPREAIQHKLGMVHQHFKLVPSLTVYENIILGNEINYRIRDKFQTPFIDERREKEAIRTLIDQYHFQISADEKICNLSVGERQKVEILKMLYRNAEILILDEPTAVLTPQEIEELLESLRNLSDAGKTIILITHKLQEVMAVSDSVTVVRKGKLIGSVDTKTISKEELAKMMVGRDVALNVQNNGDCNTNEVIYSAENLTVINQMKKICLNHVSFKLRKGEILGIAGVEGNGQSELVKVLSGMLKLTEGKVMIHGNDITNAWPDQIRKHRIGIIPEDRYAEGLCREMTISDNCICGYLNQDKVCKKGFLRKGAIKEKKDRIIEKYAVRISDADCCISALSGGNAQKIIIGRELEADPDMLIACQPTRGVDIGSIEYIHKKLVEAAAAGKGVLLISSELSEIMNLSNRILVMYKGEIIGEVRREEYTKERLGLMMAGIKIQEDLQGAKA